MNKVCSGWLSKVGGCDEGSREGGRFKVGCKDAVLCVCKVGCVDGVSPGGCAYGDDIDAGSVITLSV